VAAEQGFHAARISEVTKVTGAFRHMARPTARDYAGHAIPPRSVTMKRLAAAILLSLAALGAQAHPHDDDSHHVQCELHSDYSMTMHGKAFVFNRDDGPARHVAIGGGRLWVDGGEVKLSAADHAQLVRFEAELNRMVPRAQQVVADATDIAFFALIEVARGFNQDGSADTIDKLEASRASIQAELKARPIVLFSDPDIGERVIGPVVKQFVPVIAGAAVSSTLSTVFSGDEDKIRDFERRMDRMGSEIERKVEKRAESLESQVESLCDSSRELDRIEAGLALRIDGEPLDLLRVRPAR
jgi:hypothetical protein